MRSTQIGNPPDCLDLHAGAVEKTRTSTGFRPQRPQRCASTSSATTALVKKQRTDGGAALGRARPLAKHIHAGNGDGRLLRSVHFGTMVNKPLTMLCALGYDAHHDWAPCTVGGLGIAFGRAGTAGRGALNRDQSDGPGNRLHPDHIRRPLRRRPTAGRNRCGAPQCLAARRQRGASVCRTIGISIT